MSFYFVVIKPFSIFSRGDIIKDNNKIEKIMKSESSTSVIRIMVKGN